MAVEGQFQHDINELLADLRKTSREADKIDRNRLDLYAGMVKSAAWTDYCELLSAKINSLGVAVLDPAGSVDRAMALEYLKGTMSGLLLARDLPSVMLAAMKDQLSVKEDDE